MTSFKIKKMSLQFIVADIEHSIEFYRNKLGFDLEFRYKDFYAGLVKDGYSIHLKCGEPSLEERSNKRKNNDLDIVFSVEDVEALYREFVNKPIEIIQPLCERPYGKEFYVADPDGYMLAFLEEV